MVMKLDYQLKLEQTQKLIITPELKLAIALLQYSALELIDYVQEELLNNPVLEMHDSAAEEKDNGAEAFETQSNKQTTNEGFSWEEYFRDADWSAREDTKFQLWEGPPSIENCAGGAESMMEDLLGQLRLMGLSPREFSMASFLVESLDQNGYLRADLDELAQALGVTEKRLYRVLKIVQRLEPTGIASRNLQECLLNQLISPGNPSELAVKIVRNYLPAAADGRFNHIASRLNCDLKAVQEAIDLIRTLNPKPGSIFGEGGSLRYIIPDIIVEKVDQEYVIMINESAAPHLFISPFYHKLLQNGSDDTLSSYIRGKFDKALWLIRSIEQRRVTLYKVARQIVDIQRSFLEHGIKQLKPLTLREVAQQVGIHESTVSRATNNKYIQTPKGLYPMKFFFSSGLTGDRVEGYSSHSIKTQLRETIDREEIQNPLSDQQLTDLFQHKGIKISRRTIAKYREEMSIPPSYKRRRL